MKKMLTQSIFLISFLMIISSCSDDNPSSSSKGKIQPMTIGSWWLYDNYEIDMSNSKTKNNTYDSVVAHSKMQLMEKDATVFMVFDKNQSGVELSNSENFYYEENEKLYMHSSAFTDAFSNQALPITFKEQWMKVADKNDEDWKVYDDVITPIQAMGMTVSGKIIITGEKGGTKNFEIGGKTLRTYEYLLFINFTGSVTTSIVPLPFAFTIDRIMKLYFADGIGLVCQSMEPTTLPFGEMNLPFPGSETILTKYFIK